MTVGWLREEWLAARRADDTAPHPADCTCRGCARDAADPLAERADRRTT